MDQKEERMKKFWKWMLSKDYARKDGRKKYFLVDFPGKYSISYVRYTPQMLIGYMLEYIREHEATYEQISNMSENDDSTLGIATWSIDCYEKLVSIIKEMDGEE